MYRSMGPRESATQTTSRSIHPFLQDSPFAQPHQLSASEVTTLWRYTNLFIIIISRYSILREWKKLRYAIQNPPQILCFTMLFGWVDGGWWYKVTPERKLNLNYWTDTIS